MDIPQPKRNVRYISPKVLASAGAIAALISAMAWFIAKGEALQTISQEEVWLGMVKRGALSQQVRGVGELTPKQVRWVVATSPGTVEQIVVKPGARVEADTIIAYVSNPQLMRQRQQAMWDLDAARANFLAVTAELQEQKLEQQMLITEAEMALESAQMTERAQKPLAAKNIISELDFENTKLQTRQSQVMLAFRKQTLDQRLEVIEARLAAEGAQVQKYQNLLADIDAKVAELEVTAGIDGVLQATSVEVGQQVTEGMTLAQVANPESLQAELQIPQVQAKDLQIGLAVTIDTRNGIVDGQISRIDPRVTDGNVQVDVDLTGPAIDGMRPALSVTGTITIDSISDTLYVERPTGTVPGRESDLFVFNADTQIASKTRVTFGRASVSHIEVISGLNSGDQVLISDASAFVQQNAIRITR